MVRFTKEKRASNPISVSLEQDRNNVSIELNGIRVATFHESGDLVLVALNPANKKRLVDLDVKIIGDCIKTY